jgi:thiamine-monophosphate kinase
VWFTAWPEKVVDEFDQIAQLFRPLTFGAPEALELMDDAAIIAGRPGFDLVVTKDAMVEGVHFLSGDPLNWTARKLLRVNLSDLAAKGATPFGYFLAVAWPHGCDDAGRWRFAEGLKLEQLAHNLPLLGGDTVSTPGPLTASVTLLGWVEAGRMVKRSGARAGDILLVSGTIGDGGLGLQAAQGRLGGLGAEAIAYLADRYRLPSPRLALSKALRDHASAAADVSDGLLADAGHIGEASGLGVVIDLERLPISAAAAAWRDRQADVAGAHGALAGFGDDYEVVCTAAPGAVVTLIAAAAEAGVTLTPIGAARAAPGVSARWRGVEITVPHAGWRHP